MDPALRGQFVQRLGGDIGAVGPDDCVAVTIQAYLGEERRVMERLEHSAVVEQVGEVNVAGNPILEAKMDGVAVNVSSFRE